jgi:hypothetical protein
VLVLQTMKAIRLHKPGISGLVTRNDHYAIAPVRRSARRGTCCRDHARRTRVAPRPATGDSLARALRCRRGVADDITNVSVGDDVYAMTPSTATPWRPNTLPCQGRCSARNRRRLVTSRALRSRCRCSAPGRACSSTASSTLASSNRAPRWPRPEGRHPQRHWRCRPRTPGAIPPRELAERYLNHLRRYTVLPRGGHFVTMEYPDVSHGRGVTNHWRQPLGE